MPTENEKVADIENRIVTYNEIRVSIEKLNTAIEKANASDYDYIEDYRLFTAKMNRKYNSIATLLYEIRDDAGFHMAKEWVNIEETD